MKLLTIAALAAFSTQALATNIVCNPDREEGPLEFNFFSKGSMLAEGKLEPLIVVAQGVLRLTYTVEVEKLPESTPERVVFKARSFQESGWHDMKPVEAKISFDLKEKPIPGRYSLAGTGSLSITNEDHGDGLNLQIENHLTNCTGSL